MYDLFKALKSLAQWTLKKDSRFSESEVAAWANQHAFTCEGPTENAQFTVSGAIDGHPWKIERRAGSRQFIKGDELMARAVLDLPIDPVVIVMNRALKDVLEKQAYSIYTDQLRTLAEPSLTEEMRWLALYPECHHPQLSQNFHLVCSILAGSKTDAVKWISPDLAELVWRCVAVDPELPFILMVLRGKVYLQRQLKASAEPDDVAALAESVKIFRAASESALAGFSD